jgi:NADH-quinone oxidoreductase subunit A
MLFHFGAVGLFLLVAVLFIFGTLLLGRFVRPDRYEAEKASIYECGEPTIGSAWVRYNIRFYTVALVYLIFDVETVFLFPVALVLKEFKEAGLGALALFEILFFVLILLVGLVYAWRYGNLDWIRGDQAMAVAEAAGSESEA